MTTQHEVDRELHRLLAPEPADVLAERVFDGALARIEKTHQLRAIGAPSWRPVPMHIQRLAAIAAITVVVVGGGLFVVGGRPAMPVEPSPIISPAPSPSLVPSPSPSPSPSATVEPTPLPPVTTRLDSPVYGYSIMVPDAMRLYPAREAWNPSVETTMASPWLERIRDDSNLMVFSARSLGLDAPLSSSEWVDLFEGFTGSPVIGGAPGCAGPVTPDWQEVEVDGEVAYQTHEYCGPTWLVTARGDRGYVFTWFPSVDDTPELRAPYDRLWEEIRGSIELTPETALPAEAIASPSS